MKIIKSLNGAGEVVDKINEIIKVVNIRNRHKDAALLAISDHLKKLGLLKKAGGMAKLSQLI